MSAFLYCDVSLLTLVSPSPAADCQKVVAVEMNRQLGQLGPGTLEVLSSGRPDVSKRRDIDCPEFRAR